MMRVAVDRRWRVWACMSVRVPIPAARVWAQARDLGRFATFDALHGKLRIEGGQPAVGARLTLEHGYAGLRLRRVGHILRWVEGTGYSFSDLSARGPHAGFPHIYSYALTPDGPSACRVRLDVRGRWTATWLPRPVVRAWLWWVMAVSRQRMHNRLLLGEIAHRRRVRGRRGCAPGRPHPADDPIPLTPHGPPPDSCTRPGSRHD